MSNVEVAILLGGRGGRGVGRKGVATEKGPRSTKQKVGLREPASPSSASHLHQRTIGTSRENHQVFLPNSCSSSLVSTQLSPRPSSFSNRSIHTYPYGSGPLTPRSSDMYMAGAFRVDQSLASRCLSLLVPSFLPRTVPDLSAWPLSFFSVRFGPIATPPLGLGPFSPTVRVEQLTRRAKLSVPRDATSTKSPHS